MLSGVDILYPMGRTITQTSKADNANKQPGKSQIRVIRPVFCQLFGVCFDICRLCGLQSALSAGWVGTQYNSRMHWGCQNGAPENPIPGCGPRGNSSST